MPKRAASARTQHRAEMPVGNDGRCKQQNTRAHRPGSPARRVMIEV
jgi:hypothetical protein